MPEARPRPRREQGLHPSNPPVPGGAVEGGVVVVRREVAPSRSFEQNFHGRAAYVPTCDGVVQRRVSHLVLGVHVGACVDQCEHDGRVVRPR